jgi:uncharacterized membrane protein YfcA
MGIVAFQVVWFIVFWRDLGPLKYIYAIYLIIITGSMLFGGFYSTDRNVDSWGHIGGFVIIIIYALFCVPQTSENPEEPKKTKCVYKVIGILAFAFILGGSFALFWMKDTSK